MNLDAMRAAIRQTRVILFDDCKPLRLAWLTIGAEMADPKERILAELRDAGDYVSGQDLCLKLGMSRAAVAKHVEGLRRLGYGIDSVPRHGHKLVAAADVPLGCEVARYLDSRLVGSEYIFKRELKSTNTFLSDLPPGDCTDGMVVAADMQTAGRGRMQRVWHSPSGANLYFSILLQPKKAISDVPQLTLVSAAAVVEALERVAPGLRLDIKWPNDLLIAGRKLAGILCEMQAEADMVQKVILGIGINVNITASHFPAELRKIATSIQIVTGRKTERARLMGEVLNSMDRHYSLWRKDGLAPFLPLLRDRLYMVGKRVRVSAFDKAEEGIVAGLSDEGGLVLKQGRENKVVFSGEVQM